MIDVWVTEFLFGRGFSKKDYNCIFSEWRRKALVGLGLERVIEWGEIWVEGEVSEI